MKYFLIVLSFLFLNAIYAEESKDVRDRADKIDRCTWAVSFQCAKTHAGLTRGTTNLRNIAGSERTLQSCLKDAITNCKQAPTLGDDVDISVCDSPQKIVTCPSRDQSHYENGFNGEVCKVDCNGTIHRYMPEFKCPDNPNETCGGREYR